MLRQGAAVVRRVDEPFLDSWTAGRATAPAAIRAGDPTGNECLTLYGRLRDRASPCTDGGAACSSKEREKRELKITGVHKQRELQESCVCQSIQP
ncbi:hypothetical protein C2845_PM03G13100 [Panicum miliaceum]|uniref:Uncharacterized protein n=1 Tax=Panicum miliaceum TaxID=4540 RepID=A0A3L6T6M0_PANMI|nr:hypothetical protein C2845_PM03G13100 [Panicum miliaceum]